MKEEMNLRMKMNYVPFHKYFHDLANAETRSIIVYNNNEFGVPPDEYGFMELFCEEPGCDYRRTMLMVISRKNKMPIAIINYGWENRKFYEKWFGEKDKPEIIDELKGPIIDPVSSQSKYGANILAMFISIVLKDEKYVERLQHHYRLFKDKINSQKLKTR